MSYYARLWPVDVPDQQILVDDFIQLAPLKGVSIAPLNQIKVAIEAEVQIAVKGDKNAQKRDIGFVFDEGSPLQKLEVPAF